MRASRSRSEAVFVAVALAVYVLVTAFTAWHHEPYDNEADPWLVARDASLGELSRVTGHVGAPGLWYLLLMPLAKLGLPYEAMRLLTLGLAWMAAAIVLCCAPWPRLTRALVVFSHFVLCEYAVLMRNTTLSMLLLFTAAALWRRRFERPLAFAVVVGLLANTNTLSLFIAATIGGLFLWDLLRRGRPAPRALIAAAVMLLAGLAAVAQLVPQGPSQLAGWLTLRNPQAPWLVLALLFPLPSPLAAWVGDLRWLALLILAAFLAAWSARPRLLLLFLLPAAGMLYTFAFKWFTGVRHAGMVFLLLLFVLWVARLEPAAVPGWSRAAERMGWALLHVGLVVLVAVAVEFVRLEVRYPYSHAEQMGAYLAASGLDARPLATNVRCESVVPYLRARTVYYADAERWGSYRTWDARDAEAHDRPLEFVLAGARRAAAERAGLLLLVDEPLPEPARHGFRPLYATRGPSGPSGERFFLYEPLPAAPRAPR
ncbi:MAG TPA: hypothetical protein VGC93_06050 [Thermoanaerobaculia bacterium]